MTTHTRTLTIATMVAFAAIGFATLAQTQDSPFRKEIKRADLTGTKMEVVLSTAEYKPGETIARHIHHFRSGHLEFAPSSSLSTEGSIANRPFGVCHVRTSE